MKTIWYLREDGQCLINLEIINTFSDRVQIREYTPGISRGKPGDIFAFRYSPFLQYKPNGDVIFPNERPYEWPSNYMWTSGFMRLLAQAQGEGMILLADYLWEAETTIHSCTKYFFDIAIEHGIDLSRFILATNNGTSYGKKQNKIGEHTITSLYVPWWLIKTHYEFTEKIHTHIPLEKSTVEEKDILCLNRRVRRNKLATLIELYRKKLLPSTLVSLAWLHPNTKIDIETGFFGNSVYDLFEYLNIDFYNFTSIQPPNDAIKGSGIRSDEFLFYTDPRWYLNTKISCVTETFYYDYDPLFPNNRYYDRKIHLTEKTWKAIWFGHPFVLVAEEGGIEAIRRLGFATFNGLVDESYDAMSDQERLKNSIDQIPTLIEMTKTGRTLPITEHNAELIRDRSYISSLLNKYLVDNLC